VVSRRTHRRKAARMNAAHRKVHRRENAPGPGSRGVPRTVADDSVGVESTAAFLGYLVDRPYVGGVVHDLELVDSCMPALEVIDRVKELRIEPEGARYSAETAYVLRVPPPGIVTAAVAAGNEGGPHLRGDRCGEPLFYRTPAAVRDQKSRSILGSGR
jgi:hypothetical protein